MFDLSRKSISYYGLKKEDSEDTLSLPEMTEEEKVLEDESSLLHPVHFRPRRLRCRHVCIYPIVILLSLLVGALFSQFMRVEYAVDGYPLPYGRSTGLKNVVWNINVSFADESSELTDAAWTSLIPKGRGFVIHPKLAPTDGKDKKGKSVSVFHEIHCLHGIRTALFTTAYLLKKEKAANGDSGSTTTPHDHPAMAGMSDKFTPNAYIEASLKGDEADHLEPHHLAHCFHYIRQALMCAADSNLEDVVTMDDMNGHPLTGTEGWGSTRVCRDFWGLHDWTEKWRSHEGTGIS